MTFISDVGISVRRRDEEEKDLEFAKILDRIDKRDYQRADELRKNPVARGQAVPADLVELQQSEIVWESCGQRSPKKLKLSLSDRDSKGKGKQRFVEIPHDYETELLAKDVRITGRLGTCSVCYEQIDVLANLEGGSSQTQPGLFLQFMQASLLLSLYF